MKYDFLIVGAGLFGSTFANEAKNNGKTCLVIDKRNHIGGNCYTENIDGINIHKYGPHIFHTNDEEIWKWVNQFVKFNNYKHTPKVNYNNKIYSFPINLFTLYQLWGVSTPSEAIKKLNESKINYKNPSNLKEWILSQVGEEIYEIFIKGYTLKQWGTDPENLPSSIIKRIPIRINYNDNYFFDKFQGIPIGGYTNLFENILKDIEIKLNTDYFQNKEYWDSQAETVVYTGKIDEYFNYIYGELEYRSLEFSHEKINLSDFQGCSIVNYTDNNVPFTRITEHKHFEDSKSDVTWISKEYPKTYKNGDIPYYPINDDKNNKMYNKYKILSEQEKNVIFGGRLSEYKYYDMHQIIASAKTKFKKIKNEQDSSNSGG